MQQTDPLEQVKARITATLPLADVWVFNELGAKASKMRALQDHLHSQPGWDVFLPGAVLSPDGGRVTRGSSRSAVAIAWRTDVYRLVTAHSTITHGGVVKVSPTRVIQDVLLEDVENLRLHWHEGTHVVHRIDYGGRARTARIRGWIPGQTRRARIHFLKLAQNVRKYGSGTVPLFGSGDLNVDYQGEHRRDPATRTPWFPYTLLGSVADIHSPNRHPPTHGGRLIDWGWKTGDILVRDIDVLGGLGSDHKRVVWTVRY